MPPCIAVAAKPAITPKTGPLTRATCHEPHAIVIAGDRVCAFRLQHRWFASPERSADPRPSSTAEPRGSVFNATCGRSLAKHCFECHGPDTQESGLRVDRRADLLKGGKSGHAAVVPGKSAESRLLQLVSGAGQEIVDAARRRAADRGAKSPRCGRGSSRGPRSTKVLPIPGRVPISGRSSPCAPGDLRKSTVTAVKHGRLEILRPIPSTSSSTRSCGRPDCNRRRRPTDERLIRRLYLDVLGLPPSPEEIAQFAADADPAAWNRLVDRVLANPHFGERWARHWLDVVRFAETDGFETNVERPNAYPYRDYLISAFNADKPYDRLVFEQFAGDSVGEDAATGFLVGGPCDKVKSPDPVLTRMQRQDELTDIINTTGTAFLGLTLGCAKCHNHKFDPIPQRDFYAVQAVFAGVQHGERSLGSRGSAPSDAATVSKSSRRSNEPRRRCERSACVRPLIPAATTSSFSPLRTRRVRFTIRATNDGSEPCLDELQIFAAGPNGSLENVALASAGAKVSVSSVFPGSSLSQARASQRRPLRQRAKLDFQRTRQGLGRSSSSRANRRSRKSSGAGTVMEHTRIGSRPIICIEAETADGRWTKIASSDGRLPAGSDRLDRRVLARNLSRPSSETSGRAVRRFDAAARGTRKRWR